MVLLVTAVSIAFTGGKQEEAKEEAPVEINMILHEGNKSRTKRKGASLPCRMVRQEERAAYIFLLTWLCGLLLIMTGPLIASFQIFDQVYVLGGATGSHGGRGSNLLFYLLNVWNEGFRNMRLGYASALAWVLIIIAAIVVILTFKSSERLVYYEHETTKR